MSTLSDSFPANQEPLSPKNGLSDAEKLKKRREARNKRILASGSDRLNRIVGLTARSKTAPGPLDHNEPNKKETPPSPILSETFYSEPNQPTQGQGESLNPEKTELESSPELAREKVACTPENPREPGKYHIPFNFYDFHLFLPRL